MYWVRLGRADQAGRVPGQVRERVERGLRETEGGPKGEMIKKKEHRAMLVGEGEGEDDGLGRGVGGM